MHDLNSNYVDPKFCEKNHKRFLKTQIKTELLGEIQSIHELPGLQKDKAHVTFNHKLCDKVREVCRRFISNFSNMRCSS